MIAGSIGRKVPALNVLNAFAVWYGGHKRFAGVEQFQPVAHAHGGLAGCALQRGRTQWAAQLGQAHHERAQYLGNAVVVAAGACCCKRKPDAVVPDERMSCAIRKKRCGSNLTDCKSSLLDGNPNVVKSNVLRASEEGHCGPWQIDA